MTRRELDTLLADRALVGLDSDDTRRLEALLAEHPDEDADAYEREVGDLDVALWGREEAMPAELAARLAADAEAFLANGGR
jgi:hypothetical protein